jgi:hypothetical protein
VCKDLSELRTQADTASNEQVRARSSRSEIHRCRTRQIRALEERVRGLQHTRLEDFRLFEQRSRPQLAIEGVKLFCVMMRPITHSKFLEPRS